MCTFLAINTGSVQLIPATAIALLASAGATQPTVIVGSTLVATFCAAVAGLTVVKVLERMPWFRMGTVEVGAAAGKAAAAEAGQGAPAGGPPVEPAPLPSWGPLVLGTAGLAFLLMGVSLAFPAWVGRLPEPAAALQPAWIRGLNALSLLAIPFLLVMFPLYAALRRVPVYEEFVEGAREGFQVALRIIPFLVAMLVAIGFLRGAGAVEGFTNLLRAPLAAVGFPAELLPIALIRPLSGSASLAALGDLIKVHGPDSLLARSAATLFGSTETTFYVLAVYFGSVGVRRVRHALWAGLAADATGILTAVVVCRWMFV